MINVFRAICINADYSSCTFGPLATEIVCRKNLLYSNSTTYACIQRHVFRKWNILFINRFHHVTSHQFEHYLEALGDSNVMLQPKEDRQKTSCSELNFLGFLPIIPDRRNKQKLVNVT